MEVKAQYLIKFAKHNLIQKIWSNSTVYYKGK